MATVGVKGLSDLNVIFMEWFINERKIWQCIVHLLVDVALVWSSIRYTDTDVMDHNLDPLRSANLLNIDWQSSPSAGLSLPTSSTHRIINPFSLKFPVPALPVHKSVGFGFQKSRRDVSELDILLDIVFVCDYRLFSRPHSNGRAVALMLQCCVRRLYVTLCIVAKRCVLEQKLLLTAYRKSYNKKSKGTKYQHE